MDDKTDVLVLGATGFTGRLITRYLSAHPQRKSFTLALGARSSAKLRGLLESLSLQNDPSIRLLQVDVTNEAEVERAVSSTRVVINAVGPYWRWGTPVVRACVRNGVHYVDLTGETAWIRQIIQQFDYAATKSGAIIVPSCGYDSIPSDIVAYLSNKTLKALPTPLDVGSCMTAFEDRGGVSGGTLNTVMSGLEEVPEKDRKEAFADYCLSPVQGRCPPLFPLYYSLAVPGSSKLIGSYFILRSGNKAVVQRTFGLLEVEARTKKTKESKLRRYGPEFLYDECALQSSVITALLYNVALITTFAALSFVKPFRWLVKKIMPQPGDGPSDEKMQKGYLIATNITTSTSNPPVYVKTVLKCKGDPGYLLTAIMISESALCLLFPSSSGSVDPAGARLALPPLAQRGGVLTPMTAFGDILIQRLGKTSRFEFSSSVIEDPDTQKRK